MPLRVDEIVLREIRLPLREPFRISSGVTTERRILLLELKEADGATAWSECVAAEEPNYSPETIDSAWQAITQWGSRRVLGRSFAEPSQVHPALEHNFRGHPMAKATVEMGFWALHAKLQNAPLWRTLGGVRERVDVGISIGLQETPEALVERAQRAVAAGYRKIKLKVEPGSDIEFVRAVRAAIGEGVPLSVDANSAYTLEDAEHLARLDAFDLLMLEQPLDREDLVRHAELQNRLRTPICLDESITSLARVEDMIALGSGRIVNIKPGRVGGLQVSKAIHDLCGANDIPVWCGGMLESGVGRAYNVALSSLANFSLPGDISPSARYWERDIVIPEWTMDANGQVTMPDGAGLGVRIDIDRVEDLTTRREVVRTG